MLLFSIFFHQVMVEKIKADMKRNNKNLTNLTNLITFLFLDESRTSWNRFGMAVIVINLLLLVLYQLPACVLQLRLKLKEKEAIPLNR